MDSGQTPPAATGPSFGDERRAVPDRRGGPGRRAEDHNRRLREAAATLLAFCGALAVLYVSFAIIGAVDFGDTIVFTIVAAALALVWLAGVWQRARTGGRFVTRPDRERRGF
jgi:hypothetical protein